MLTDSDVARLERLAFASTNDGPGVAMQRYWYCKGLREGAAIEATPQPERSGEVVAPVVKWIDQWDCEHSCSIEYAAQQLKLWGDAWPCGLEEVEASLAGHKRIIADLRATPSPQPADRRASHDVYGRPQGKEWTAQGWQPSAGSEVEALRKAFHPMEVEPWTYEHVQNYPAAAQRIINAAVALLAARSAASIGDTGGKT